MDYCIKIDKLCKKTDFGYEVSILFRKDGIPSGKYIKTVINKPRAEEELYDLKNDPHEEKNIVKNPECIEIANSLSKKLENWMKRTNDPLLKGEVEPQSRVNFDYQI